VLSVLCAAAGVAEARVATVSWTDPNPAPSPVVGFRLHVGTASQTYGTTIELGLPTPGAGGVYTATANVPDNVRVFMAMTAYEVTGLESDPSNEQILEPLPPPDAMPDGRIDAPTGPVTIDAGQSVVFAGSGSDPDGGSVSYAWDFDSTMSGVPGTTRPDPGAVTFPNPGTFLVSLTVTDDEGNPDPTPATVTVTVRDVSSPPPPPPSGGGAGFTGLGAAGRATPDSVVATAPPGDPRLFVVARSGVIRILEGGYARPTPFLDLSDSVAPGEEGGLRGLAFDPAYASNGYFFVHRVDANGDVVVSRFSRGDHEYVADRLSEFELLRVPLPHGGNAGGGLAFGPDGFLFVGLGDGGGVGDPDDRAQDPGEWLGKVLRLDVGVPSRTGSLRRGAYAIPADNPFVGAGGVLEEIWATGLRNPERLSVDRSTGDLWIVDGGSGIREEIDFESGTDPGGHDYGWDVTEGTACNAEDPTPGIPCDDPGITDPLLEFAPGGDDCGVIGGFAYRGAHPDWRGEYFFADGCSGNVWSYDRANDRLTNRTLQFVQDGTAGAAAVGLGEGGTGELYVLAADGAIYRIRSDQPACSDGVDDDGDGLVDHPADPGCASPEADTEVPLCDDGFDNDLDGDTDTADAQCGAAHQNIEAEPLDLLEIQGEEIFCGLGAELVFVIPLFMGLRRTARRATRRLRAGAV
jgi:glucose/arabinose dehydrogenase